ncbi:MAG: hypothetical protein LBI28_01725 [Treponema sp.]|jgi:hypothetical protein|nr:hypothetical protein [Treponema sp.]
MYNLDTKEEVDLDQFMEALENNEIQIVSRELTEEEKKELSRDIAACKAIHQENLAKKAVLA